MSETLLAAGIGLIGAMIGGGCSYLAMWMQIREQRRRDEEEAERQVRNVIRMWLSSVSLRLLDLGGVFSQLLKDVSFNSNKTDLVYVDGVRASLMDYTSRIRERYKFEEAIRFIDDDVLSSMFAEEEALSALEGIIESNFKIVHSIAVKKNDMWTECGVNICLPAFYAVSVGIDRFIERILSMYRSHDIDASLALIDLQNIKEIKLYREQYEQFVKQQAEDVKGDPPRIASRLNRNRATRHYHNGIFCCIIRWRLALARLWPMALCKRRNSAAVIPVIPNDRGDVTLNRRERAK